MVTNIGVYSRPFAMLAAAKVALAAAPTARIPTQLSLPIPMEKFDPVGVPGKLLFSNPEVLYRLKPGGSSQVRTPCMFFVTD